MKTRNDTGPASVRPGDIDHDFTDSVNRRNNAAQRTDITNPYLAEMAGARPLRMLSRALDHAIPVALLLGAMAVGWFAHSIFHN